MALKKPKKEKPKIKFKIIKVREKRVCVRAPGQSQKTMSMSTVTIERAQKMADMDGRTWSSFVARLIEKEWAKMLKEERR